MASKPHLNCHFEDRLVNFVGLQSNKNYLEFIYLYNWSSIILKNDLVQSKSVQIFWDHLNSSLKNMCELSIKTNVPVSNQNIQAILSYIQTIFKQDPFLQQNKLCVPFIVLCWNVLILILENDFLMEANQLCELISRHHSICECQEVNGHLNYSDQSIFSLLPNLREITIFFGTFVSQAARKHQEALIHLSNNSYTQSSKLKDLILYQKGYSFFGSGEFKLALDELIPFSSSIDVNQNLQCSLLNCIGCCLSEMGKPRLASSWFCKAFEINPVDLFPAWNLANQFRKLKNKTSEIEVRTLIVEYSYQSKQIYGVSHIEALYTLAKRCKDLLLFSQAARFYKDLLQILTENSLQFSLDWKSGNPPLISHIIQESAYSLLQAGCLEECISFCNVYIGEHLESTVELEPGRFRTISTKWREALRNNKMTDIRVPFTKSDSLTASTIKAIAICKQGLDKDALDEFNEIRKSITTLENDEESAPIVKKPLLNLPFDKKDLREIKNWSAIISHVYCNMGVLATRKGLFADAIHLFRVALVSLPGNLDAIYNYVLLLMKTNRSGIAKRTWNDAKANGSDLNKVLESDEENCVSVSTVSKGVLIKLDKCLSSI